MTTIITVDKDILGGTPVFTGTRVPIESLFRHIAEGAALNEFLEDFPTVSREQVIELLNLAHRAVQSSRTSLLNEDSSR
jgi:uncharacterized protein (DUF433 family)